jgi:hypothetical protein
MCTRISVGSIVAALAAGTALFIVTSGAIATAGKIHPPGASTPPRSGTGLFAGISAWGTGAPACGRVEGPTVLRFFCHGIQRNFIGSYVLIRFPSKNFNAFVQLAADQDSRRGLVWTEQDIGPLTFVYNRNVILGSESVTLTGASVPGTAWDLGLEDYPFRSPGPRVVNAEITITAKPTATRQ